MCVYAVWILNDMINRIITTILFFLFLRSYVLFVWIFSCKENKKIKTYIFSRLLLLFVRLIFFTGCSALLWRSLRECIYAIATVIFQHFFVFFFLICLFVFCIQFYSLFDVNVEPHLLVEAHHLHSVLHATRGQSFFNFSARTDISSMKI